LAQLFPLRDQAFGATGSILAGAKLYLYDSVATTTPKAAYTDSALTIPHAFPIVADSSGVFAQIYASAGATYHAILKTSAGVTIQTFENWQALGAEDNGTFEKDFGANGRLQAYGSGGVVQLEAGNAVGDDVGGSLAIGGWDGTVLDSLTVNALATTVNGSVSVLGDMVSTGLVDGASSTTFWVKLVSGAITAAATTDIALSSGYNSFRLEITFLRPSTALDLSLRFSYDNGATYKAGATDYVHAEANVNDVPALSQSITSSTTGDTLLALFHYSGALHANGFSRAIIEIDARTGQETIVTYDLAVFGDNNAMANVRNSRGLGATNGKAYGKADHVRILTSTGTITARYALYGKPGF